MLKKCLCVKLNKNKRKVFDFIKFTVFIFGAFCYDDAYANPEPLGIKLNQDNINKVKEKYKIIRNSDSIVDGYHNISLSTKNIDIESISKVLMVSNPDGVIEAVVLTLGKNKFEEFSNNLKSKYKLIKSEIPFVGNKQVVFKDGDCEIEISAPHMSFDMDIIYATNNFLKKINNQVEKEEKEKKEVAKNLL